VLILGALTTEVVPRWTVVGSVGVKGVTYGEDANTILNAIDSFMAVLKDIVYDVL